MTMKFIPDLNFIRPALGHKCKGPIGKSNVNGGSDGFFLFLLFFSSSRFLTHSVSLCLPRLLAGLHRDSAGAHRISNLEGT